MFTLNSIVSQHRVFVAYIASLLWLATAVLIFSLTAGGSLRNLWLFLGLIVGCILCYGTLWKLISPFSLRLPTPFLLPEKKDKKRLTLLSSLVLIYVALVVVHFYFLGFIPILRALDSGNDIKISIIRQEGYFNLPLLLRYGSDYTVKALGPGLLLLAYYFRTRLLFWIVLVTGVIYCAGLFVRTLPIFLFFPLLVYQLMQRRWLHLAGILTIMFVMLLGLTAVASITLRNSVIHPLPGQSNEAEKTSELSHEPSQQIDDFIAQTAQETSSNISTQPLPLPEINKPDNWRQTSVLFTLYERMLIVPAHVMHQWFEYYDHPVRREQGCGYRWLAPILKCEYVHIPNKLYYIYYHENTDEGMKGSLNAASFMTDYANFGPHGSIISVLSVGLLFSIIMLIYGNHPLALPMNLPFIISMMETNLFTAINSGSGWLVMTLIFILFFRLLKNEQPPTYAAVSTVQPLLDGHLGSPDHF